MIIFASTLSAYGTVIVTADSEHGTIIRATARLRSKEEEISLTPSERAILQRRAEQLLWPWLPDREIGTRQESLS